MGRMRSSRGWAGALRRYRFEALALMLTGAALATGVAVVKPKEYRSSTVLTAESANGDLAGGKKKITAIEGELLQAETFQKARSELSLTRDVDDLLNATAVAFEPLDGGRFEIEISHAAATPEEALKVVAHLSRGYQSNVYERPVQEQLARLASLQATAAKANAAFEEVDGSVQVYEAENADYLAEGEEELYAVRESVEDLETREIAELKTGLAERLRLIREEKPYKERTYKGFDKKRASALERRLQAARNEIRQLIEANQWPEDHPKLASRQRAGDELETQLQAVLADKKQRVEEIPNPMYDSLKESIAGLESRLEVAKRKLGAQRKEEQRLLENARLAPDIRKKHKGLVANRERARGAMDTAVEARDGGAVKLEELRNARALKFSTVSAPSKPAAPSGPNPAIVAAVGLLVGGLAGALLAISRNGMDKSFREVAAVHAFLGIPTLGAIGPIRTADDVAKDQAQAKRRTLILSGLALLAAAGLGLALTGADAAIQDLIGGMAR